MLYVIFTAIVLLNGLIGIFGYAFDDKPAAAIASPAEQDPRSAAAPRLLWGAGQQQEPSDAGGGSKSQGPGPVPHHSFLRRRPPVLGRSELSGCTLAELRAALGDLQSGMARISALVDTHEGPGAAPASLERLEAEPTRAPSAGRAEGAGKRPPRARRLSEADAATAGPDGSLLVRAAGHGPRHNRAPLQDSESMEVAKSRKVEKEKTAAAAVPADAVADSESSAPTRRSREIPVKSPAATSAATTGPAPDIAAATEAAAAVLPSAETEEGERRNGSRPPPSPPPAAPPPRPLPPARGSRRLAAAACDSEGLAVAVWAGGGSEQAAATYAAVMETRTSVGCDTAPVGSSASVTVAGSAGAGAGVGIASAATSGGSRRAGEAGKDGACGGNVGGGVPSRASADGGDGGGKKSGRRRELGGSGRNRYGGAAAFRSWADSLGDGAGGACSERVLAVMGGGGGGGDGRGGDVGGGGCDDSTVAGCKCGAWTLVARLPRAESDPRPAAGAADLAGGFDDSDDDGAPRSSDARHGLRPAITAGGGGPLPRRIVPAPASGGSGGARRSPASGLHRRFSEGEVWYEPAAPAPASGSGRRAQPGRDSREQSGGSRTLRGSDGIGGRRPSGGHARPPPPLPLPPTPQAAAAHTQCERRPSGADCSGGGGEGGMRGAAAADHRGASRASHGTDRRA